MAFGNLSSLIGIEGILKIPSNRSVSVSFDSALRLYIPITICFLSSSCKAFILSISFRRSLSSSL